MQHFISVSEAAAMTAFYRRQHEAVLGTAYQGKGILPLSETFSRDAFDTILARPDCHSLRVYYGMDEGRRVHAVIVGVDENGRDILPAASLTEENEDETYVFERSIRCPENCPDEDSPLNS